MFDAWGHRRRLAFQCAGAECPSPPPLLPSPPLPPSSPIPCRVICEGAQPRCKNCAGAEALVAPAKSAPMPGAL
jgi:hypothetical protein